MPEDITHEPSTVGVRKKIKGDDIKTSPLVWTEEHERVGRQVWTDHERRVNGFVAQLKTKYPDLPEYHIELIGDLYGGAFRLERGSFLDAEDEIKEVIARIQHNQAHAIFYAGSSDALAEYQGDVRSRVALFEGLSNSEQGKNENVDRFWNGVKGEVGTLKTLHRLGYNVYLPDYTEDPYEIAWEDNEVLQWDLKSGVDMVAVKDGRVLLIDSKGRLQTIDENTQRSETRQIATVELSEPLLRNYGVKMRRLPPILRNFVTSLEPTDIRRAMIILPTSPDAFYRPDQSMSDRDYLASFGLPKSYIRDEVESGLR